MGHPSRNSLTLAVIAAVALVACGSDDPESAATAPAATAAPSTAAPATTAAPTSGAQTTTAPAGDGAYDYPVVSASGTTVAGPTGTEALVEIAESDLGQILATAGHTLYVFTPDEGAAAPTCEGGCADAWPPLLATGAMVVGDGLDQTTFGTITRNDGGEQVTFHGWPLYRYAADAAPGDVTGQGSGDKWFVVAPDGTVVRD